MSTALMGNYRRSPLAFTEGKGCWLTATNGERYLDCAAGIAVNALGHCHPHLVEALKTQAEKLWHTSNVFQIPNQAQLAERLVAATFADKAFFCNSGAEAMEAAIKMGRRYFYSLGQPEKYRFITFEGAFHGRTLATIAAGGQEKYLEGFGPKVDGFDSVPFGDHEALKAAITPQTAGIILEPIQGEGGIRTFSPQVMRELRALCDTQGLLMILDEIQCGMGRTGKLFAYEWSGITPDIMAVAKGIGGGFPLGACLATEKVAAALVPGTHGTTYGGNPLAMAVGNAVLDVINTPEFLANVQQRGQEFTHGLQQLMQKYPNLIKEVRGTGLILGLKLSIEPVDMVAALRDEHVLTVAGGDNVMRILPPLIITSEEIQTALQAIDRAAQKLSQ